MVIRKFSDGIYDDEYKISKIVDILKSNDILHDKVVKLSKLMGVVKIELPPFVIPCRITLKSGERHIAYLEDPKYGRGGDDDERGIWIEFGRLGIIRRKIKDPNRKIWKIKDVKSWEFINA